MWDAVVLWVMAHTALMLLSSPGPPASADSGLAALASCMQGRDRGWRGVRRNRQFPVGAFLPPPVTVWFPNNGSDKKAGIPFNS